MSDERVSLMSIANSCQDLQGPTLDRLWKLERIVKIVQMRRYEPISEVPPEFKRIVDLLEAVEGLRNPVEISAVRDALCRGNSAYHLVFRAARECEQLVSDTTTR
jgi:hypothetical protein